MIKAEFLDLGLYNGMHEPDPAGSYRAFIVYDEGQPGDKPQNLTFVVPAHQFPTYHAKAEQEAAVASALEKAATKAEEKCNKRRQYELGQSVRDTILNIRAALEEKNND